ncbi:MAG: contact-dependent growth inhibition system immunity protein [Gemmatimonadaceae bacterium]
MKQLIENEIELYAALRTCAELGTAVPAALDVLERDPLASAGYFRGDLLRALIDLPPDFWRRNRELFRRYQGAVRAGAIARRSLPSGERMEFWS